MIYTPSLLVGRRLYYQKATAAARSARLLLVPLARLSTSSKTTDSTSSKQSRQQLFSKENIELYPRYLPPGPDAPVVTVHQLVDQWDSKLSKGEKAEDQTITLQARITNKREASKKLVFYDVCQQGYSVQVVASKARYSGSIDKFSTLNKGLKPGDIISVQGFVGKTNTGELSLFIKDNFKLLSPCYHDLPVKSGLREPEKRFRNRHLDLLINPKSVSTLLVRSKVLKIVRKFLDDRGFVEVETPILSTDVGGANARPFVTRSMAFGNDLDMYLRIAPELFLKKLVIGGMEKVYEIGKQFRNEGVDSDHNPEFTTCEFYEAYNNLDGLISKTESLLHELATQIRGSDTIHVLRGKGEQVPISFKPPYRRIHVGPYLEERLNTKLPDLHASDAVEKLLSFCQENDIKRPEEPHNVPRIMDHLISILIEPECIQPTFIMNHPTIMSPLAKSIDAEKKISGRLELFVNGKEIVNAYEELNDPDDQRQRFQKQMQDRLGGDQEVPLPDNEFCDALEYGLPPTSGWGMGIDRVVALLAEVSHLRETIAFPVMRPSNQPQKSNDS